MQRSLKGLVAEQLPKAVIAACLACVSMTTGCQERAQAPPSGQRSATTAPPVPPPPPPSAEPFCVKDDPGEWLQGTSRFVVVGAPAVGDAWRGTAMLSRTGDHFHVVRNVAGKPLEGQAEKQNCGAGEYGQFLVRYDDGSVSVCSMTGNGNNELRFVCDARGKGSTGLGMEIWFEPPAAASDVK